MRHTRTPFTKEPFDLALDLPLDPSGLFSLLPASYSEGLPMFMLGDSYEAYNSLPGLDVSRFLSRDLSVHRLNAIEKHLWLAVAFAPLQPLNSLLSSSRVLVCNEEIEMHLVWEDSRRLHLKPLPRYLLDARFWSRYLVCNEHCACAQYETQDQTNQPFCVREKPYTDALGFLFSYITLIRFESDFMIAKNHSLFPQQLTWETWMSITQQTLITERLRQSPSPSPNHIPINSRYRRGALRLSRLNWIYAIRHGNILSGYRGQYKGVTELFQENLAPITVLTVYLALVLTAMQVGLANDRLGSSKAFQNASYGFTVFSILGPLGLICIIWFLGVLQISSSQFLAAWRLQVIAWYEAKFGFTLEPIARDSFLSR